MSLSQEFLDEVRSRTRLSALIGRSVKLTRAGREFKACCPFHNEKSPSFTVNDDKGFYHCFGCGAHGDAFRWLTDQAGLPFIDAVRELAEAGGVEMPAPSPQAAERAARVETVRGALEIAQSAYAAQLDQAGAVMEYLAGRGIGPGDIAAFGIGYARGGDESLRGRGIGEALGLAAGVLTEREAIGPDSSPVVGEQMWDRITIPIHDGRGRLIGFGGRVWPQRRSQTPKFLNTPETALFDKGRTLFNLHRAAPASRPQAANRVVIVEGYMDVIALAGIGLHEAVAPLGTALTERQLELAWRLHHRPVLLFDGDAAGRKASLRACLTALPTLAPGRELAVALLPAGKDPDDLVRELGQIAAAREISAALIEARPAHGFVFESLAAEIGDDASPEARAGVWEQLAELAAGIADDETRAQYLGLWRARFERELSALPQVAEDEAFHAVTLTAEGDYAFPDSASDSAARLIAIVQALLKRRAERKAISEEIKDLMGMAKLAGFEGKAITAALQDIESDLSHGPAVREDHEMVRVLYRRTLGIRGPMSEAMLPQLVDGRARQVTAGAKRRATMHALLDAGGARV